MASYNHTKKAPSCKYCGDSGIIVQVKSDRDGLRYNGDLVLYEIHARCFCNAGMARNELAGWPAASRDEHSDAPTSLFDNAVEVDAEESWWDK